MGAPKQKWTAEEEEALKAGVMKHGAGKWRNIQTDPEFRPILSSRSNIDLKDKWRNMSLSATGLVLPRDKNRRAKAKCAPVSRLPSIQVPAPVPTLPAPKREAIDIAQHATKDSPMSSQEEKMSPRYTMMIMDALNALQEPNGVEIGAIFNFIKQKHEVPESFKRGLGPKLKKLVSQSKIEKVNNAYKVKIISSGANNTSKNSPKQKDPPIILEKCLDPPYPTDHPKPVPNSGLCKPIINHVNTIDYDIEAFSAAACKIAEAEMMTMRALEAVREAERVSKLAEHTESLLKLVEEIFEYCERGETVNFEVKSLKPAKQAGEAVK